MSPLVLGTYNLLPDFHISGLKVGAENVMSIMPLFLSFQGNQGSVKQRFFTYTLW